MFSKKKTECRVCGYRFTPERENIYTAEEPRSALEMLTAPSADRHSIFSRLHLWESGNPLRARAATVHGRRRERRRSRALPVNGSYL